MLNQIWRTPATCQYTAYSTHRPLFLFFFSETAGLNNHRNHWTERLRIGRIPEFELDIYVFPSIEYMTKSLRHAVFFSESFVLNKLFMSDNYYLRDHHGYANVGRSIDVLSYNERGFPLRYRYLRAKMKTLF